MVFWGLNFTGAILSHAFRLHIEHNSLFNMLSYYCEYSTEDNSVRIVLEFLKIQLFISITSNCQDLYNYCPYTYFIDQDHIQEINQPEMEMYESEQ